MMKNTQGKFSRLTSWSVMGLAGLALFQHDALAVAFGPVWESKTTPVRIETLLRGEDHVARITFHGKPECEYGYAVQGYRENLAASIEVQVVLTSGRKCFFEHANSATVPMTTEISITDLINDLPQMAALTVAIGFQRQDPGDYDSSFKYVPVSDAQFISGKTTLIYQTPGH